MEEEQVLFKLDIDFEAASKSAQTFVDQNGKLNSSIEQTEKNLKELKAAGKENTDAFKENTKALALNKDELQKNSIKSQEYANMVEKSTTTVDKNTDAVKKQNMSVSDYADGLDKVAPGMGGFISGMQGMIKASLAFIATPIGAIIAAIGLALGALIAYFKGSEEGQNRLNKIVAIGSAIFEKFMDFVEGVGEALYDAFTNPKQAMIDLYEFLKQNIINRFTAFKVILEGILELDFKKIGNGIIQAGTGIENAIDKVQNFAKEVVAAVDVAIDQGTRIAEMQAQLDRNERTLLVERAKTAREVAKLREAAIKEEGDVKRAIIEEAIALEKSLIDKEVADANVRLKLAKLQMETNGDDKEAKLAVAEATANVINKEAERYSATLRFQKELEKLNEEDRKKAEDERKKQEAEDIRKMKAAMDLEEFELALAAKREEDIDKRVEKEIELEQYRVMRLLENDQLLEDERQLILEKSQEKINDIIIKANADKNKKLEADNKKAAEAQKKIEQLKNEAFQNFVDITAKKQVGVRVFLNSLFKQDALKETFVNTKAAAMSAYKALAGIPIVGPALGAAAAIAVGLFGAQQAAGILGVQFAKGGKVKQYAQGGNAFTIGGNSHSMGGTKFWGEDGTFFEAERGEGMYILKRDAQADLIRNLSNQNTKFGGVSWLATGGSNHLAQGGAVAASSVGTGLTPGEINSIVKATMDNFPPIYTDINDVVDAADKKAQIVDKASF